ncbi:MAG: hypothetical protein AAFY71_06865 [Bacteroidota bacterium]
MVVNDTTFEENGYSWGVQILSDKDGRLLIEEDFFQNGVINRIRIEHPKWQGKNGISIGQTYGSFKDNINKGFVSFIPSFEMVDLVSTQQPSIHYLFKVKDIQKWAEMENPRMQDLSDDLVLTYIVIM